MSRSDYTIDADSVHEVDAIPRRDVAVPTGAQPPRRDISVLLHGRGWLRYGNDWFDPVSRVYMPTKSAIVAQLRRNLEGQGEQIDERVLEAEADAAMSGQAPRTLG